jgi:hypothetical protein
VQTLELLTKAQDLIRSPDKWTQGYYSRDALGNGIGKDGGNDEDARHPAATCFCSIGAIYHLDDGMHSTREATQYLNQAAIDLDRSISGAINFNDIHTHAEVMAMWDRAKELASVENN